jgi:transcriptional regulator with XRE-family HTH domain
LSFLSARRKANLSQAAVAEKFGISAAAVSQWETGKTIPRGEKLREIAEMYGCTVDELLTDDKESET